MYSHVYFWMAQLFMGSLWKHIISHQCDINFCESFRWAAARCNKIYITAPQKKCFLDVTIIFMREEWEETESYNNSHEAFICVKNDAKVNFNAGIFERFRNHQNWDPSKFFKRKHQSSIKLNYHKNWLILSDSPYHIFVTLWFLKLWKASGRSEDAA